VSMREASVLPALRHMVRLQRLELYGSEALVGPEYLVRRSFARLPALTHLRLTGVPIAAAAAAIAQLRSLEELVLSSTGWELGADCVIRGSLPAMPGLSSLQLLSENEGVDWFGAELLCLPALRQLTLYQRHPYQLPDREDQQVLAALTLLSLSHPADSLPDPDTGEPLEDSWGGGGALAIPHTWCAPAPSPGRASRPGAAMASAGRVTPAAGGCQQGQQPQPLDWQQQSQPQSQHVPLPRSALLPALQRLELNSFWGLQLPPSFSALGILRTLVVHHCALRPFPAPLLALPALERLSLQKCTFGEGGRCEGELAGLAQLGSSLTLLDLRGTRLEALPQGLAGPPNLERLLLQDNPGLRLTAGNVDVLRSMPRLRGVWLSQSAVRGRDAEGYWGRLQLRRERVVDVNYNQGGWAE
jgi:Leucine-rich repeat (LRR) protein